jgi:2',3'-cyclic-nucleotide 2'-phosphodiesterase (5'-nucleotidase family)
VIETLTGAQFKAALENGFKPPCGDVAGGTGRTPQISGIHVEFHCNGTVPVVDSIAKVGAGGALTPVGPADPIRFVTNDFMYTGGDGYTAFAAGTNVLQPGDALLDVTIDYITAHSPVAPAVEGRWIKH